MLPAPAQGAIGIECRTDDSGSLALIRAVDHAASRLAVEAERAFTKALGGTCHSPVAALALISGDQIAFEAQILSVDGGDSIAESTAFAIGDSAAPAQFARRMLSRAPDSIRRLFEAG
jgi:hydroxymethylbilane synthase